MNAASQALGWTRRRWESEMSNGLVPVNRRSRARPDAGILNTGKRSSRQVSTASGALSDQLSVVKRGWVPACRDLCATASMTSPCYENSRPTPNTVIPAKSLPRTRYGAGIQSPRPWISVYAEATGSPHFHPLMGPSQGHGDSARRDALSPAGLSHPGWRRRSGDD